jgi:hypothetical protein
VELNTTYSAGIVATSGGMRYMIACKVFDCLLQKYNMIINPAELSSSLLCLHQGSHRQM